MFNKNNSEQWKAVARRYWPLSVAVEKLIIIDVPSLENAAVIDDGGGSTVSDVAIVNEVVVAVVVLVVITSLLLIRSILVSASVTVSSIS